MKKIFLTLIMVMGSVATAQANDEVCELDAEAAAAIMSARQAGVPMAAQLYGLKNPAYSDYSKNLYKKLIVDAYSIPRFELEKNQKKSTADFKDQVHVDCLKNSQK